MEYVNEDELKSAIIRLNNGLKDINSETDLKRLKKYIERVKSKKLKSQKLKRALRKHIVTLSERNAIDYETYELFGEMITLVIKNMLKKPNFSGYTYRDEFYSDTCYKILKYIKNFNHKLISVRSGQSVSAFAYISQIVKHSLIAIIEQKNEESKKMKNLVSLESAEKIENINESTYVENINVLTIHINEINETLVDTITKYLQKTKELDKNTDLEFIYPETYKISLDEYSKLTKLNKEFGKNIVIRRANAKIENNED